MPKKAHCTVLAGWSEGLCTPKPLSTETNGPCLYLAQQCHWFVQLSAVFCPSASRISNLSGIPPCSDDSLHWMTVSCNLGRQSPLDLAEILKSEENVKPQLMRTVSLLRGQAPQHVLQWPELAGRSCVCGDNHSMAEFQTDVRQLCLTGLTASSLSPPAVL